MTNGLALGRRLGSMAAWAVALGVAALAPGGALALTYQLELHDVNPNNQFERQVYICGLCTPEQFAAVPTPAGFNKPAAKLFLPEVSGTPLTPPPGVPASLDLVPEIAGDDFNYVAHVVSGQLVGSSTLGFTVLASVERTTLFLYGAGDVVHLATDPAGDDYVLFSFGLSLLGSYDLNQVGSLSSLALPAGWTYSSHVLADDLAVVPVGGVASVLSHGQLASWQRIDAVPEPGTLLLVGVGLVGLLAARRAAA